MENAAIKNAATIVPRNDGAGEVKHNNLSIVVVLSTRDNDGMSYQEREQQSRFYASVLRDAINRLEQLAENEQKEGGKVAGYC